MVNLMWVFPSGEVQVNGVRKRTKEYHCRIRNIYTSDTPQFFYEHPVFYECCDEGGHFTFDFRIFEAAKFTILTPLSLLISCKRSFPVDGLKMSSLLT
jgi:hypothetical protein